MQLGYWKGKSQVSHPGTNGTGQKSLTDQQARLRLHCCYTPRQLASAWVLMAVPVILIVSGVQRQKGMTV